MTIILGLFIIQLIRVSAVEFPDSSVDNATDDSVYLVTTTETSDNGMTLGDIPDQVTNENEVHDFEVTVVGEKLTDTYPPLEMPENHKNYSTPFVSSIELPPLLNQFSAYQQQYRDYYKQKSQYGLKPIKFETNAAENHYVSHGLSAHLEDDAVHRYEELKYERQPFPYTYENERLPFLGQSAWTGQAEAQPLQNEVTAHHYQPYDSKLEGHITSKEKVPDGWKKALKFFTALVPLGLLLATFTPSVISINSTVHQKPLRQRSLKEANLTREDFLELFKRELNVNGTGDPECDRQLICEMYRRGQNDTGTNMQKRFWYLTNRIADDVAEELGTRELFQVIREGDCELYKCSKRKEQATVKRVTKRRRKKVAEA